MARLSGRWWWVIAGVVVVVGIGLYALGNAPRQPVGVPAVSAPATQPAQASQTIQGMSAGQIIGLVLKVGIVAALLVGSLWLLRRYAGTTARIAGRTGVISIVDQIMLAQGRTLYVLDVGDRAVVIGATPQSFSPLSEITDPETLARLRAKPPRPQSPLAGLTRGVSAVMQVRSSMASPRADDRPAPRQRIRPTKPATTRRSDADRSFEDALAAYGQPNGIADTGALHPDTARLLARTRRAARPEPEPDDATVTA